MQFLRSKGIAHMDLKPQNLLLTEPPKTILKIAGTRMSIDLLKCILLIHVQGFRKQL